MGRTALPRAREHHRRALAERLRHEREAAHLSIPDTAEALGLTLSTYRMVEDGKRPLPVECVPLFLELAGITAARLFRPLPDAAAA